MTLNSSGLTAAHAAIETEKAHGAQRLADQQTRHDETISQLRVQFREAGRAHNSNDAPAGDPDEGPVTSKLSTQRHQ
ncbi:MAG TPA: hypothetical protein VFO16_11365 [Pseudonocardiaceae bacterium]|nr:hypothetical protein [Pseudonocardiaceae bacterium]